MYNNYPYGTTYSPQMNIEKIDKQIADLEKLKNQIQHPLQPITQNFQIAPTRESIRYVNSLEDVQKEPVYIDTAFFSKDMSVLWVKSGSGEVAGEYPDKTLLITMEGHITCSVPGGIIMDSFDCRKRIVEDAWIIK